MNDKQRKYIFIVGVGRSGTSLLHSMIASNSNVFSFPEISFIRRYIYENPMNLSRKKNSIIKLLNQDKYLNRLKFDSSLVVEKSLKNEKPLEISLYENIINNISDKSLVVDKDPKLIELLPIINNIFPSSVVINIIRDPRDILLSKKKASWSKSNHVWKHVFANLNQIYFSDKFGKLLFKENYIEIFYEDLISDPEETLKNLCNQINLSYENKMLNYSLESKKIVSIEEKSWKKETFGPILKNNKNKWKKELPDKEIVLIQNVCKKILIDKKYKSIDKKLNLFERIWTFIGAVLIFSLTPIYIKYKSYKVLTICRKLN